MNCCNKQCSYKELNGGDEISDFYYCKYVGVTMDRGNEKCLLDRFEREAYQEALEQFKTSKEFAFADENLRMEEFYNTAIIALEKQIPMKVKYPININGKCYELVTYCFSCGEKVKDMKYCCNCGQRLDWEI